MLSKCLIINADDFGYSSDVNRAVVSSFSQGLCSSTTLMTNMPGFEEACQLCRDNRLTDRVGLHLVLSEGTPLTNEIKKCSRLCNSEGCFYQMRRGCFFKLSSEEKDAVAHEISAQIERCRRYGILLSHVDSHHHIHVEWGIAGVLLRVAKAKKVRHIRLARHLDTNSIWFKNLYRLSLNMRIALNGAAATRYFGTVEDYLRLQRKTDRDTNSFEIMIHPSFDKEQLLIDDISKEPLGQYVAKIVEYRNAISFADVSKSQYAE